MWKRFALAAALLATAALTAGCAMDTASGPETTPDLGVDIIVPYATTTASPDATQMPAALYIGSDGNVVLNDDTILANNVGTESAHQMSIYTQLRLGSGGVEVSAMQERLTELGYYSGGISGVFDEETEYAVKQFERGYGTMQTGIATAAMQERLYSASAMVFGSDAYLEAVESHYELLEEGDIGPAVIALQYRLQELGYPIDEVTGVYDGQTCDAVRLFYKQYGVKARDYAIVDLQKVLFSENALVYDDGSEDEDANALDLTVGQSGTRVTQLQLRLVELGYLAEANGVFDQLTADAISAFQTACRVTPTGVADVDIQQQLFAPDAPAVGEIKQIYALLQWGDSGEAVRALQERLAVLGYYDGQPDGVFSDDMVSTVKSFQKNSGMYETGVADIALQELAFSDAAPLSPEKAAEAKADADAVTAVVNSAIKGDSGETVSELQERLKELGFLVGVVDGKFGSGTENAVKAFQTAIGVEPTGEVSSDLMNVILSDAAPEVGKKYWREVQTNIELDVGDVGDAVVALQVRLYQLGYLDKNDIGENVGVYEEYTAAAVNEIMKLLNFRRRDGSASAEFITILYSDDADVLKK